MWRAGVRSEEVMMISFPFRFCNMSIGEPSMEYGTPMKWHQRISVISFLYWAPGSSAATSGLREAGGTFLLSKRSSQYPERFSADPGPARCTFEFCPPTGNRQAVTTVTAANREEIRWNFIAPISAAARQLSHPAPDRRRDNTPQMRTFPDRTYDTSTRTCGG